MLRIMGESSSGDCLPGKVKKVPCYTSVEAGESAYLVRQEKGKKPFCVECPHNKSSKYFTECSRQDVGSSICTGGVTERAERGFNFFPPTLGSIQRFLIQTQSVRVLKAAKKSGLLSSLAPRRDTPRRWYGECGKAAKKPKDQSLLERPSANPPCPGGEVKVRECPPPPKLPKLPTCPPPCPPPPPLPVPKCPKPPKCPPPCAPPQKSPSSPHSPPKPKCSGRNMSIYGLLQPHYKHVVIESGGKPSKSLDHRNPVFLVAHRRISTSKVIFGSKNSGDRSSKCGEKANESSNKCQTKNSAPNCAKPKKRDTKAKDCKKPKPAENCTSGCAPKPRCPPLPPPPPRQSQVQWSPPTCSPPKLIGPSPCPEMSKNPVPGNADAKPACPPPPPLPKPPCRPVCLCPCPPPPKLPPGSCPDVPTVDELSQPSCPPPCPPKLPLPCPKDTWCPSEPSCPPKK